MGKNTVEDTENEPLGNIFKDGVMGALMWIAIIVIIIYFIAL